ncbi:phostensin isoform X2 [Xenopus laevis]|uniref:Phostensin isoform X2 n=1 Tax=Xenopus laevis TaxID=8355 RepID=A0A8J0TJ81_XENLA|nr:phostensin isoform X2 [Xenopus laevis]
MMEVPDWKVHLLERRRKDEEDLKKREREEEERLAKMPAWKREIILRRKAKAEASVLEIKAEVDEGEQEESTKMEKQRRMPEYSCLRKPLPESPISVTVRTDDTVRGLNATHVEEEQKAHKEDIYPLPDEGTGIVSRILSRFGRSFSEGENGGSSVPLVNGELEMTSKTFCSDVVKSDSQASAMLAQHPPSPSCPRAATGNQTSTQETSISSLTPPYTSTSCTDSETAVLSPCMASMAKSGLCAKLSMNEEAKPFPFQLRPSSPASSRQIKQTIQSLVDPNRSEVPKHGTGQVKEDGEGGPAHNRVICNPFGNKQGTVENQAMQRRKGNTITVNPRKMAGCENGFVATETKTPVPKTDSGKKRYPTVEEIKVIGGYQAVGRSCLAKHSIDKKKLNISFPDSELESTFEYPSESSLLAEFGPPDEPEAITPPAPQTEDDEEEDSVLLGGILRRKALIVDESCKR